jgi:5'-3' exonuclease
MWILIDGNNWFCRDFFAAGERSVAQFLRRVADVRRDRKATRIAICWDTRSFRHDKYPDYKAGRDSKPDGFCDAMQELRETLATIDVSSFDAPGFEADDLLAALAAAAIDEGERATIFSTDRDLHQCLVDGHVNQAMRVLRDGSRLQYDVATAATLKRDFGVYPHQWVDYRAIVGDSSDGLKGCVGLGEKVAAEVLSRFDDLDGFYREPFVPAITKRERALLLAYAPKLEQMRDLLRLRRDAPIPATWLAPIPF